MSKNWNWHVRYGAILFIHTFTFNNMLSLMQNQQWTDSLLKLVLRLLSDEVIEVRISAQTTLQDFIKWDFVTDETKQSLIEKFKCCSLNSITDTHNSGNDDNSSNKNNDLVNKHKRVLGLSAFIYAYSTEIPDFLPDILLFLSKRISDPQPIQVIRM